MPRSDDMFLFAVNTGELYAVHRALAELTGCADWDGAKHSLWYAHVADRVVPLYVKVVDDADTSAAAKDHCARLLREYYERHALENRALAMAEHKALGQARDAIRAILFQVVQGKVLERDACITQACAVPGVLEDLR